MQKFIVTGGVPLRGEVRIAGAKNAVLKMMAAAALTDDASILRNVPRISDVQILRGVMSDIGFSIKPLENDALEIKASGADWLFVPLEAAMKMRSSFILLGPLLTRFGRVIISNPGGDRIGRRPVDLHVDAMRTLGAEIEYKNGYYFAQAPGGLKGARVTFPYVTVMGTENAMLAATLAKGTTVIENAAQEPEVDDLATMLRGMGAQIERTAPHRLEIQGVDRLHGVEHAVLGDRLEAGTFAMAAAVTGGEITVRGVAPEHLGAFIGVLAGMGVSHEVFEADGGGLRVRGGDEIQPADVETQPYPGFPTDLQAQMMSVLTIAEGAGMVTETIFENRFMHVPELARMGADITVHGSSALVRGVPKLKGAQVMATDLRASISLILAGLVASGSTEVSRVYHLDRGYEHIEEKLSNLGAQIERVKA